MLSILHSYALVFMTLVIQPLRLPIIQKTLVKGHSTDFNCRSQDKHANNKIYNHFSFDNIYKPQGNNIFLASSEFCVLFFYIFSSNRSNILGASFHT